MIAAWLLTTLAVWNDSWDGRGLSEGVLPEQPPIGSVDARAPRVSPPQTPEEDAVVEAAVTPAFEASARAALGFRLRRGDGLRLAAQLRTLRYVALVAREALVAELCAVGEGRRLLAERRLAAETGVSQPSTGVRYEIALNALRRLAAPPAPTIFVFNVVIHGVPRARGSPPESGCAPSIQLRSLPHETLSDVTLYDSSWAALPGELRVFSQDDEVMVLNVNAVLQGDVLLRVMHHPGQVGEMTNVSRAKEASSSLFSAAASSARDIAGAAARLFGFSSRAARLDQRASTASSSRATAAKVAADLLRNGDKGGGGGEREGGPWRGEESCGRLRR